MAINTKDFTTLVQEIAASVQGASRKLVDFTQGSINLAFARAFAAVTLWLQAQVLGVLALTRATTSKDADLDTWMADYGFDRLGAKYATSIATFSRYTADGTALLNVGAVIQSIDGSAQYVVGVDSGNSYYDASLGGYFLPSSVDSVSVPITCSSAGVQGNKSAGQVTVIADTTLTGFDTVTNPYDINNGEEAETDPAYLARFQLWIRSLHAGTKDAIESAIANVQQGLFYSVVENEDIAGSPQVGYFYVVVDDGSGDPSDSLINNVRSAVDAVRGFTISNFGVFKCLINAPTIELTIKVNANGYIDSTVAALVQSAIQSYVNSLQLGDGLPYSRIAQIAYDTSSGVVNVFNVLIDGGTADIDGAPRYVVRTSSVVVNHEYA